MLQSLFMNKFISKLVLPFIALSLSGCAFFEFNDNNKNVVNLGDGENFVKWSLVENNNEYHHVTSAYFEVNKNTIRYFEDDTLKKEGKPNAVYFGPENTTSPLVLQLNFGKDENGLRISDNLYCFTEDEKENVHQFTIMAEGYEVKALRMGGVPVRDYHLSEMPYVMGTYVKDGSERYDYKNSTDKDINADKLKGSFVDTSGNKFYFINNCFYQHNGYYLSYGNVYFRYENNIKNIFLEGTIVLSYYDSYELNRRVETALLYVMHGQSEPSSEKGVVLFPDYHLLDFIFSQESSFSFNEATYFYDNNECDWNPNDFIPGTYTKI